MEAQERVRTFMHEHGIEGEPEYQVLDLASEVGEMAKDAAESTDWGTDAGADVEIAEDELGDALFSLLTVAESLDVDADEALDAALSKYERRIEETGTSSSRGTE